MRENENMRKNDDERVWRDLYYTAHTFEVHVCVVLLAFTKLCFNFQPNLNLINRVITSLTNCLGFVTESLDGILSPIYTKLPTEPVLLSGGWSVWVSNF